MQAIKKSPPVLACFSPAVMAATFVIESVLAIYVAFRYSMRVFQALVCTLLLCLASFQLAEFQVCVGPGAWAMTWGKVGLVGITLLPALGMHLIGTVTRKSPINPIGYGLAVAYALTFLLVPGATGQPECMGNYVIVQIEGGLPGLIYEAYYLIFVGLAILEMILRLRQKDPPAGFGFSRSLIRWILAGYLSFTVPMAIAGVMSPALRRATPSVMCGFALILAIVLSTFAAPLYAREAKSLGIGAEH